LTSFANLQCAATAGRMFARESLGPINHAVGSQGVNMAPTSVPLSNAEARELVRVIYDHSGIVLAGDKKSLISSRLNKRLRILDLRSFRDYLRYLWDAPDGDAEIVAMIDAITTNKTEFFREHQHFDFLVSAILPKLVRSDWTTLNIWCAGCSTGEEPYSLAMVLAEYFGSTRNFTIVATDLCTQALQTARKAVYSNALGKSIPFGLRQKYTLTGHGSQAGRFRIVPELRDRITFGYHNLIASDWDIAPALDAVFCRNVMIYFDFKTRSRIIAKFRARLKPDGHLFIGHAESLSGIDRVLGFVQVRPTIYALQRAP